MEPNLMEPVRHGMMVLPGKTASPLPLKQTRVNAHLTGLISNVTVIQSYANPYESPVELEYLFPLPENTALVDFSITIGARIVRAELQELEQAQEAYERARQEGVQAAILDQRRPNLFAVQLANVLPNHPIEVSIAYEHQITIHGDELEFVFPMGLTPKYHSDLHSVETRGVDSPVASPREKIGSVEITVTTQLGSETGDPASPSHRLTVDKLGVGQFSITLEGQYIPDHDFILRFPLTGQMIEPAVWCTRDNHSEFTLVSWLPSINDSQEALIPPREFVFVLDRSGSMTGEPIRQARNALRACLRILEPKDTFRILLFDDRLEWYQPEAVQITQETINQADAYLSHIEGRGGTEIVQALQTSLALPEDRERIRYILFLTDGAVSAEGRALQLIRRKLTKARIFTFGIGPSVNRALLSKMAQLGRGAAEFLQLDEDIESAVIRFQDKVAFPVLTDIQLDWKGCKVWDTIPALLPDLYAGQSLQLVTRLHRNESASSPVLKITGVRGKDKAVMDIKIPISDSDMPEVKRAWAKARIDQLLEQSASAEANIHQIRQEVIGLAMEHRLVTPYTAFIAVDPAVVNPNGEALTIAVAQPLPKGLSRAGFFPPPSAKMVRANLVNSAMPRMVSGKRTLNDMPLNAMASNNAAAKKPGALYTKSNRDHEDLLASPPSVPPPGILPVTKNDEVVNPAELLRSLARTQNMNGSWSEDIEFTAAALLAFVRQGHTTHAGFYRKQVGRTANWLVNARCVGVLNFIRAFALYELASADSNLNSMELIKAIIDQLPPAQNGLEHVIQSLLNHREPPTQNLQRITDLDSLRVACILNLDLKVPPGLLKDDHGNLARVWMAARIM